MDKIKLNDLIGRAEQKKLQPRERKDVFVKSLNGVIAVQKPDRALCFDALDMGKDGDAYIVYECTVEPNLKDPALAQAYNCVRPLDIVEAIMDPGEIAQIAKKIIELAGFSDDAVAVVDELKN